MSFFTSDRGGAEDDDVPESVATELDRLLADWALTYRLSSTQIASVRANVLAGANADGPVELDAEWLWSLLRPLTALLEDAGDAVTSGFNDQRPRGWPWSTDTDEDAARALVPYLQLA